jgi:hypothetical protein
LLNINWGRQLFLDYRENLNTSAANWNNAASTTLLLTSTFASKTYNHTHTQKSLYHFLEFTPMLQNKQHSMIQRYISNISYLIKYV